MSSLYAPTPRFIFLGLLSLLKASVTPRMASGGPISTPDQKEAFLAAVRHGTADLWRLEVAVENIALQVVTQLRIILYRLHRIVTIVKTVSQEGQE